MEDKQLTPEEMMIAIWEMGQKAEAEGKEIDQLMRFTAIARAQIDKIERQGMFAEMVK